MQILLLLQKCCSLIFGLLSFNAEDFSIGVYTYVCLAL